MPGRLNKTPYDASFYERQSSGSLESARIILPTVFELLHPRTVVDVGCGQGAWLKAAKEAGAETIVGLDGDYVQREQLLIPVESFQPTDLASAIRVDRKFDLVISMEVAEHLQPHRARSFVADLCRMGEAVLFSAAIPFQGGTNHVNEQWPEYWAAFFDEQGFVSADFIRDAVWNTSVASWYAQNTILYVATGSLNARPEAQALREKIEKTQRPLRALVHPNSYTANSDPDRVSLRRAFELLRRSATNAVGRRLGLRGR